MPSERIKRRVSAGLKKRVAYRQHYVCKGCNKLLPPTYEVDHIVPLFKGGSNHEVNLQALCPNCHREKTQLEVVDNPKCDDCGVVYSPFFVHQCKIWMEILGHVDDKAKLRLVCRDFCGMVDDTKWIKSNWRGLNEMMDLENFAGFRYVLQHSVLPKMHVQVLASIIAEYGLLDYFKVLLKAQKVPDWAFDFAVRRASRARHKEMLKFLMEECRCEAVEVSARTAMEVAASRDNLECLKILMGAIDVRQDEELMSRMFLLARQNKSAKVLNWFTERWSH